MRRKLALGVMLVWTGICLIAGGFINGSTRIAAAAPEGGLSPEYLAENLIRLHVLANSDSEADQALKRAVRDAILEEVTPLFTGASSRQEAEERIHEAMPAIQAAAATVIAAAGQSYPVSAELGQYEFPGKAYGALWVPAGEYTALRVLIGEAEGANWWCVLFPPMCFVDWATGVVLEPKPGSAGTATVPVTRTAMVDEEQLGKMPVKARFAILEWIRRK